MMQRPHLVQLRYLIHPHRLQHDQQFRSRLHPNQQLHLREKHVRRYLRYYSNQDFQLYLPPRSCWHHHLHRQQYLADRFD
jgi:hypothetical protein